MTDKINVIVGGSTGMGFATAEKLAAADETIVIIGRNSEKLADAKSKIAARGATVETVQADVGNGADIAKLVDWITAEQRHIAKLVMRLALSFPNPSLNTQKRILARTTT